MLALVVVSDGENLRVAIYMAEASELRASSHQVSDHDKLILIRDCKCTAYCMVLNLLINAAIIYIVVASSQPSPVSELLHH